MQTDQLCEPHVSRNQFIQNILSFQELKLIAKSH